MEFVCSVLLIDDNPSCNYIMTEFIKLADDSIDVLSAESVTEALDLLDETKHSFPDVIYVDLNMPVQDGFDFIEHFQSKYYNNHQSCKLFMLTSSLRSEDRDKAMGFSCVEGFVSKNDIDDFLQQTLTKQVA